MNAESLAVMLRPLRRLRVSQKLEFRSDCLYATELPPALQAVVGEIAGVVVGNTGVETLGGERGVFRALWVEARERGVKERMGKESMGKESMVDGELQFTFWAMEDGFEGRRAAAREWFLKGVEDVRRAMGDGEGVDW